MFDISGSNRRNFVEVHILANLRVYIHTSMLKVDVLYQEC